MLQTLTSLPTLPLHLLEMYIRTPGRKLKAHSIVRKVISAHWSLLFQGCNVLGAPGKAPEDSSPGNSQPWGSPVPPDSSKSEIRPQR